MLMKSSLVTRALSSGGAGAVDAVPGCAAPASVPAPTREDCWNEHCAAGGIHHATTIPARLLTCLCATDNSRSSFTSDRIQQPCMLEPRATPNQE